MTENIAPICVVCKQRIVGPVVHTEHGMVCQGQCQEYLNEQKARLNESAGSVIQETQLL